MKKVLITFSVLFIALTISFNAQASSLKENMIEGIKFLDTVEEVDWYRVEGRSLIIGWKRIPKFFPHTIRKAARPANIATSRKVRVWAVRHTQKNWHVGSGKSYICFVTAINGKVTQGNCDR